MIYIYLCVIQERRHTCLSRIEKTRFIYVSYRRDIYVSYRRDDIPVYVMYGYRVSTHLQDMACASPLDRH
jgi:hypothetical protein